MVITFDKLGKYGRLGNSMFQYATLKSVGIRNGYKVKIPRGNYPLRRLNLNSNIITNQEAWRIKKNYGERFFHYDERVYNIADWTNLFGYFQSYKYFDNIKNELLEEFKNKKILDKIGDYINLDKINISVHVRRGDYLRLRAFHPFPGLGYYKKCFKFFMDRFEGCVFNVFSDDIPWCRNNFKNIKNKIVFFGKDEIYDLHIMSACDHNILGNSSFSWWGAYLNSNQNKIVIYPNKWFGPKGPQDYYDLIPKSWRKLG